MDIASNFEKILQDQYVFPLNIPSIQTFREVWGHSHKLLTIPGPFTDTDTILIINSWTVFSAQIRKLTLPTSGTFFV